MYELGNGWFEVAFAFNDVDYVNTIARLDDEEGWIVHQELKDLLEKVLTSQSVLDPVNDEYFTAFERVRKEVCQSTE